jgi:hypothetical protein
MAGDEEFIAAVQSSHQFNVRNAVELTPLAPVALATGEDQIPDPIHISGQQCPERPREKVIHIGSAHSRLYRDRFEAVEAAALLVAVEGRTRRGYHNAAFPPLRSKAARVSIVAY